jgi:hypothetical protein
MKLKTFRHGSIILCCSLLSVWASPLEARGLDQLKPGKPESKSTEEAKPKASDAAEPVDAKKAKAKPKAKTQDKGDQKAKEDKPLPPPTDRFFMQTGLSWTNIDGDKGGWHSSVTSDVTGGMRFFEMWQDRLRLYGTLRYLPVDVVVKYQGFEYRGVVESYLGGVLASFRILDKLYVDGAFEAGLAKSALNPLEIATDDQSLESEGVQTTLSTGITWRLRERVRLGSRLFVGAGTFRSIQWAAHVSFSL